VTHAQATKQNKMTKKNFAHLPSPLKDREEKPSRPRRARSRCRCRRGPGQGEWLSPTGPRVGPPSYAQAAIKYGEKFPRMGGRGPRGESRDFAAEQPRGRGPGAGSGPAAPPSRRTGETSDFSFRAQRRDRHPHGGHRVAGGSGGGSERGRGRSRLQGTAGQTGRAKRALPAGSPASPPLQRFYMNNLHKYKRRLINLCVYCYINIYIKIHVYS